MRAFFMFVKWFFIPIIFLIFFAQGVILLDPDFGWHLSMGQHVLQEGLPPTDLFSYTMPSYPFVDPELGGDVIIATLYPKIGLGGLAAVSSLLIVSALAFQGIFRTFAVIPYLLGAAALTQLTWVRPQVVTLFFFSVIVCMLLDTKRFARFRFILPMLFLVWANIHGGFVIGLLALGIFVATDFVRERRSKWINLGIFLGSLFITLVNPYGIRLWQEVWITGTNSGLRWGIAEWTPTIFIFSAPLLLFAPLALFLLTRYRKKFSLFETMLFVTMLLLAISSIRHIVFWIVVAIPVTIRGLLFLSEEAKKKQNGSKRFAIAYRGFFVIALVGIALHLFGSALDTLALREDAYYPKKAIRYLTNHRSLGQIFSDYNWGGYLIWKLPEKKVFIDGRMAVWRRQDANDKEENNAFGYYADLSTGKIPFTHAIAKYTIDTVLLPVASEKGNTWVNPIDAWLFEKLPFPKIIRSQPKIIAQLQSLGWKKVYEDRIAVIYRKQ